MYLQPEKRLSKVKVFGPMFLSFRCSLILAPARSCGMLTHLSYGRWMPRSATSKAITIWTTVRFRCPLDPSFRMAQLTTPTKDVTLDLQLTSVFASSGPQKSSADPPPLVLVSQGVQGKLNLKYNEHTPPIRPRDIVKISLHGMSSLRTAPHTSLTFEGTSRTRVPYKGYGVMNVGQRYPQLQSSVSWRSKLSKHSNSLVFGSCICIQSPPRINLCRPGRRQLQLCPSKSRVTCDRFTWRSKFLV